MVGLNEGNDLVGGVLFFAWEIWVGGFKLEETDG